MRPALTIPLYVESGFFYSGIISPPDMKTILGIRHLPASRTLVPGGEVMVES